VRKLASLGLLLIATTMEASGDAVIRMGLSHAALGARIALFLAGTALLFIYGLTLNLAPFEFGKVIGLYIATFFVMWQVINLVAFRAAPTLPIVVGGALIVAGGMIVTFWRPN
jgi:hypothetical protein